MLIRDLRSAFGPRGLLLTAAVSANKRVIDLGTFLTWYHFVSFGLISWILFIFFNFYRF